MRRTIITHDEAASLLPYRLQRRGSERANVDRSFFLSFGDAFRGLMQSGDIKAGVIMVPDFYCPETLDLYARYGTLIFYHVRDDLTIDIESYLETAQRGSPAVIVHYGFLGFPADDPKIQMAQRAMPDVWVIEDCAHKILFPEDINFMNPRHIYIDSIRKQTSLLGSHLYSKTSILATTHRGRFTKANAYRLRCLWLRIQYEAAVILARIFHFEYFYAKSDEYFERFNAVIGTSEQATRGGMLTETMWEHLDFAKIIRHKKNLIQAYSSVLSKIQNEYFHMPTIFDQNITYFPCLVSLEIQDKFLAYLNERNIWMGRLWELGQSTRAGFNGELLKRVIVLPLTWLTSCDDARRIGEAIKDFFKATNEVGSGDFE